MNPLVLLLGIFGAAGAFSFMGGGSGGNAESTAFSRPKSTDTSGDDGDGIDASDDMRGGGNGNGKGHGKGGKHDDSSGGQTGDGDSGSGDDGGDIGSGDNGDMSGGDSGDGGDMSGGDTGDGDDGDMSGGDGHDGHGDGGDMSGGDTGDGGDGDMSGGDGHDGHNDGGDMSGGDTGSGDDGDMSGGDGHDGHGDGGDMSGGDTGDGGDTGGGNDGHDGHGDTPPDIPPPGVGASQSAINAYLTALANAPEIHVHDASSSKAGEHNAAMNLVDRGEATHVAIGNGDWSDPSIWSNGEVPGDDAKVLIPDGVSVDYSAVSDARLFTLRVDGQLEFATDTDSQMIFDTFIVSPTGHLVIGTADNPVEADVNVDLIVANNGRIDTNWDPMLLSRGLISHGETTIHGAEKDAHEKVTDDPMAGDTSVRFASAPEGWQVGDTIVIAGTHYDGYKWNNDINARDFYEPEDEVRVITEIRGGEVFFDQPLVHDHDTPRDDLHTSVANYTRNVSVETENGEDAEIFERGHVMFMHSDDVDVRYAEFTELGRTDKSELARDVNDINTSFDSNIQGRYSLHLHRTGVDDLENPTILQGNAVFGSPGWGIVHHDSNAVIDGNATYDTFGAGYVAETGNETGIWSDNIAIFAQGVNWEIPKNSTITGNGEFDTARGGEGFWFQGRMVAAVDNVAASVNTGFSYFHRGQGMIDFDSTLFELPDALYGADVVTPDDVPILTFQGNEAFAAREGLHVVKANTEQGHDVWSRLEDFTAWSVMNGVELEYTSHYILSNFDLVAKEPTLNSAPQDGITFGNNLTEIIVIDSRIEGFRTGIDLNKSVFHDSTTDLHDYHVINTDFINVQNDFVDRDGRDTIMDNAPTGNYQVDLDLNFSLSQHGGVQITGTKTDGLGRVDFPNGMDEFIIDRGDLIDILDTQGYWTTPTGREYALIDIYFTDRLTGDIYYETSPVFLDNYPVGDPRANAGAWANNVHNGVQAVGDFSPVSVPTPTIHSMTPSISALDESASVSMHSMVSSASEPQSMTAMLADIWMDGYDGDDVLTLGVDDGTFTNTGHMSNVDLVANGGETVLATGGAEFEVGASRTLAVVEAAAKVGFDGDDGDMAILDMEEGATLAFAANDGDLATIEEAEGADVLSGIDLGGATLSIDLSGLSAEAGNAFTLMSADEIVGIFNEAVIGGLGARDARIVVDYENDSVSLELAAGNGAVTVDTHGAESDVTTGQEALWNALTAGHGVASDTEQSTPDDDIQLDEVA